MASDHQIIIESELEEDLSALDALLRRVIPGVLAAERVMVPCEVDVLLTDDAGIREINREQRDIDAATDVLSFPTFNLQPGQMLLPGAVETDPDTGLFPLGDMVLSVERARSQAAEYGHSVERETAYLAVHSILHLLGYDHMDEGEEKARMRQREESILSRLSITRED